MSADTSRLPAAEAAQVAAIYDVDTRGSANFVDVRNFQEVLNVQQPALHRQGTLYVRAKNGVYSVSRDGRVYQAASASQGAELASFLTSAFSKVSQSLVQVRDVGRRRVAGTLVERYTAEVPAKAVSGLAGSLGQLTGGSAGSSAGIVLSNVLFDMDVVRATGLPLDIVDSGTAREDLSALHRPGVSGIVVVHSRHSHSFSQFKPTR